MQKYVKLHNDGTLEFAPQNQEGISNWINDVSKVLEAGYLPLIEAPKPQDERRYKAYYEKQDNQIVEIWVETPLTRGEIEQIRRKLYRERTDELAAEYMRKSILGVLIDSEKAELEDKIRTISEQIVAENPYPQELTVETEMEGE